MNSLDLWKIITPSLALIGVLSSMLFFYVRTTIKSAIDDLMLKLEVRFTSLDVKITDKINSLEKNDIRADGVTGAMSEFNLRLKETNEYSHAARHEIGNRLTAHELTLNQHGLELQALSARIGKVEQLPDLIDAKLNAILEKLNK